VARTLGNLTPYPREGTRSSNTAAIGARLSQSTAQDGGGNQQTCTILRQSGDSDKPLTRLGPHAITVNRGEAEWMADGLKIDPFASNVGMSNSARLTYPAKRLQTLSLGGGGSYAYGVVGRGPIMVANALPVPDGLMVRSPDHSVTSPHEHDGVGAVQGNASMGSTGSVMSKPKPKRGDAEANAWHCSQVTSALRWEVRTPHLTMPVPSKAVQQDGHLSTPTNYGYDAPSRLQKWAIAGSAAYSSFLTMPAPLQRSTR